MDDNKEASDGKGRSRIRVNGPEAAKGDRRQGGTRSTQARDSAPVDVSGGEGGRPQGRTTEPCEPAGTARQLAERIVERFLRDVEEIFGDEWDQFVAPDQAAMTTGVLEVLRENRAWFCRTLEDPDAPLPPDPLEETDAK